MVVPERQGCCLGYHAPMGRAPRPAGSEPATPMTPRYSAALFDLDNTLWDRTAAILATGRLLHQTEPAVRAAISAEEAAAKFVAFDGNGQAGRDRLIDRVLAEWPDITRTHEEMVEWYLEASRSATPPDQAVLALLRELNATGVPWGIVTNGTSIQHATVKARAGGARQVPDCVGRGSLPQARSCDIPLGPGSVGTPSRPRRALHRRRPHRGRRRR